MEIKWVEVSNGNLIRWDKVENFYVEYYEREDSSHRVTFRIDLSNGSEYGLYRFESELVFNILEMVKYDLLDYINKNILTIISQADLQICLTDILSKYK